MFTLSKYNFIAYDGITYIFLSIIFLIYVPDYAKKGIKFKQTWKTSFFVAFMFFAALGLLERPQALVPQSPD